MSTQTYTHRVNLIGRLRTTFRLCLRNLIVSILFGLLQHSKSRACRHAHIVFILRAGKNVRYSGTLCFFFTHVGRCMNVLWSIVLLMVHLRAFVVLVREERFPQSFRYVGLNVDA